MLEAGAVSPASVATCVEDHLGLEGWGFLMVIPSIRAS